MENKTEDYKKELLSIFFAQQKVVFWVTVIFLTCSILIAFLWPPTYSASGSILIRGKKSEKSLNSLEKEDVRSFRLTTEDLASEVEIITSPDVIQHTIKYINESNLNLRSQISINSITNDLIAEIVPATNVIRITLYNKHPQDAKTILEALMKQYILFRMQIFNPKQAELFLSYQLDKFTEDREEKVDELLALTKKTQLSDPQKEIENNLLVKMNLEKQLNILKDEAIEKGLYIKHLEKLLSSEDIQYFSSIENLTITGINGLSNKLQELVAEQRMVLRTFQPLSKKVQSITRQINDAYSALKNEVIAYKENLSNQLQIINAKIDSIEKRIIKLNTRNVEVRKQQINIAQIDSEIGLLQAAFETISTRGHEARIGGSKSATNPSHVSILSTAYAPESPAYPKKGIIIPLGLIIGFLTGCSLGFLREYFDHTFKKPADVENNLGLPVILSIPE